MRTARKKFAQMIATALVLVAALAFILPGSASAHGGFHADAPCPADSGVAAVADHNAVPAPSHRGATAHTQDRAAADQASSDAAISMSHANEASNTKLCCRKLCSAFVCALSPDVASAKQPLRNALAVHSQVPEGIGPSGLKRPPRTIGMT